MKKNAEIPAMNVQQVQHVLEDVQDPLHLRLVRLTQMLAS